MPIYEYECEACGDIIERLYLPGEEAPGEIEEYCDLGGFVMTYVRVLSPCNFKLKGFGWAYDGYSDRPWGKKPYGEAVKDGYIPGSYVETGKAEYKKD